MTAKDITHTKTYTFLASSSRNRSVISQVFSVSLEKQGVVAAFKKYTDLTAKKFAIY